VWVKICPNYNIPYPNVPSRESSTEKGTQAWGRGVAAPPSLLPLFTNVLELDFSHLAA
jgi:hypothetical protein